MITTYTKNEESQMVLKWPEVWLRSEKTPNSELANQPSGCLISVEAK